MIRHISAIAEVVDDVDAAVEFYRDVLGLTVEHKPGGHYATVEISGALHFSIWSRSAAAEATFGDVDCNRPHPARLFRGVRGGLGKRRHGCHRRARMGCRPAAEDGVMGPIDEPLHAPQRDARRLLGNAMGTPHQPGPEGDIRVVVSGCSGCIEGRGLRPCTNAPDGTETAYSWRPLPKLRSLSFRSFWGLTSAPRCKNMRPYRNTRSC